MSGLSYFSTSRRAQAWPGSIPPLGCSRSAHASTWPLQQLLSEEGAELDLNASRRLKGLQLRLPRQSTGQWQLQLVGRRQVGGAWQALELGAAAQLRGGGQRQFVELPARCQLHRRPPT